MDFTLQLCDFTLQGKVPWGHWIGTILKNGIECTLCLKVKKKLHNIEFISFELLYINFHPAYLSQSLWQQALQGSILS